MSCIPIVAIELFSDQFYNPRATNYHFILFIRLITVEAGAPLYNHFPVQKKFGLIMLWQCLYNFDFGFRYLPPQTQVVLLSATLPHEILEMTSKFM